MYEPVSSLVYRKLDLKNDLAALVTKESISYRRNLA